MSEYSISNTAITRVDSKTSLNNKYEVGSSNNGGSLFISTNAIITLYFTTPRNLAFPNYNLANSPREYEYTCISKNGAYLGAGKNSAFYIDSSSNYQFLAAYSGTTGYSCRFSDDNVFFFHGGSNPKIMKFNGASYQNHQTITPTYP